MRIDTYDLEIFTPPCDPGAERYSAKALLAVDISEVLPYLNATLPGAVYHPGAQALTWKQGGHAIAFHPQEIAISNLADRDAAVTELDGLVGLVNRTWARRAEIEPSYKTLQRPTPMAVYKLLPRTNCRQCGEQTCYNYALKLLLGQKTPADCPPLQEPANAPHLAALQALLPGVLSVEGDLTVRTD